MASDVPDLVAEVRRLRADLAKRPCRICIQSIRAVEQPGAFDSSDSVEG